MHKLAALPESLLLGETTSLSLPEEAIERSVVERYDNIVVIPAFNEGYEFLQQNSLAEGGRNLVVLVVNLPEQCDDVQAVIKTKQLISYIQESMELVFIESELSLYLNLSIGYSLLLVDLTMGDKKIPNKLGVGLARKVGADIATILISRGIVRSRMIYSTDADAQLPAGYFDTNDSVSGGYVYPFRHMVERQSLELAMQLYEFSLHYYVAGLGYAGSSYAFHTIGSCLAVNYEAYAKVRGFPKRAAGEDFYLLNKIAKVGELKALNGPIINIAGRVSDRVPFGTGPAISKISCMKTPLLEYKYYDPRIFECLRLFLNSLEGDWEGKEFGADIKFGDYQEPICSALEAMGFYEVEKNLQRQSKTLEQFLRRCAEWFDAFRTLKFIHFLRDNYFSSVPIGKLYSSHLVSGLINQYPALFDNN